ncbi:PREDICTED: telomerase protein component 1-like [Branchiostoma belcheri]|uniref:Telomerase protein component 1-like n=1 Tax=Branchiostoma belcheri TaxID=7741 RepID=A0A6P5ARF2_BRABE|nr:PREDICTED: telomerase protein component 1-like [Branchiostoma belcheri]
MGTKVSKARQRSPPIGPHPEEHHGTSQADKAPPVGNGVSKEQFGATKGQPANQMSSQVAAEIVSGCWKTIEQQCAEYQSGTQGSKDKAQVGWQEVRVFVSSTFADFHAEREALVKKVFPELREWCEGRQLHLVECDLRWGVPKDSTSQTTISICLEELDRCLKETDGQPFFLAMLGERYGWIPSTEDVSADIRDNYDWVDHLSITHMEITHGALRPNNPNAAFFLRDPMFLKDLPEEFYGKFVDDDPLCVEQLKELKSQLHLKFPDQTFDYRCNFSDVQTADNKVQLSDLDDFCSQVVQFFKNAFNKKYPEDRLQNDPLSLELLPHDTYMQQKGQLVLGREAEMEALMQFATGDDNSSSAVPSATDSEQTGESSFPIMMVVAQPGTGKSALMAKFTMEVTQKCDNVLYHFVGCGPDTMDPANILQRLYKKLDKSGSERETEQDKEMSPDQLKEKIQKQLRDFGETEERLIIIIDAVNQLADHSSTYHLDWLALTFPCNVRCIVSTTEHPPTLSRLKDRQPPPCELTVPDLDKSTRQDIVTRYFKRYNKALDKEQLELLTSSDGSSNPMWLAIACEELRVFGVFEQVTAKIQSLPPYLEGLLSMVISRVIQEDETRCAEKMLCLLECSQSGLQETQLQVLLGDPETATPLPMLTWSQVHRSLKPFLRNTTGHLNLPSMDFCHNSIRQVVQETLMSNQATQQNYHKLLADYYQGQCASQQLVALELPYHLQQAGLHSQLVEFVRKDLRSLQMGMYSRQKYMNAIRCRTHIPPGGFHGGHVAQIVICKMCSMQMQAFTPARTMNKDTCVICGHFTPFKKEQQKVQFCMLHKPPLVAPGQDWCLVCEKPAIALRGRQNDPAYLCMMCSVGICTNRCAKV